MMNINLHCTLYYTYKFRRCHKSKLLDNFPPNMFRTLKLQVGLQIKSIQGLNNYENDKFHCVVRISTGSFRFTKWPISLNKIVKGKKHKLKTIFYEIIHILFFYMYMYLKM